MRLRYSIELSDEFFRVRALAQSGEADEVGKQHRHRLPRAFHRAVKAARILQDFLDQVSRNVTLERAARAQFFRRSKT